MAPRLFFNNDKHTYALVNGYSDEPDASIRPLDQPLDETAETYARNIRKLIIALVTGATLALIMIYLAATTIQAQEQRQIGGQSFVRQCGDNPETARAMGCRFEVHNFAWVAPECFDEELTAEWDEDTTWSFSRSRSEDVDREPPNLYTREEGYSGDLVQAWVPWRQHIAHCAFVIRKYARAVESGAPMDNWTASTHHMDHCVANFLKQDIPMWSYTSVLHMKFPVCDYSWQKGMAKLR